jgi:hypothetical protein
MFTFNRVKQKVRELCRAVFEVSNRGPFSKDFSLKDQIWRASGSAMDNIAEGFDDMSRKEFIKFLAISESPKAITCRFLRLFGFSAGSMECTNLEL